MARKINYLGGKTNEMLLLQRQGKAHSKRETLM